MPNRKRNIITLHIVTCVILMVMPVIDAPSPNPMRILLFENPFVEIDFVLHGLCILFGFLNYFVLLPRYLYKRLRIQYIITVFVAFAIICFIPISISFLFQSFFGEEMGSINIHIIIQIRHVFFLFITIFLYSLMVWSEGRRRRAEREKSLAEMQYLKAQINPHFLFNSLNSVYALLEVNPKEAGNSLIQMSNIMRNILHASNNMFEPLSLSLELLEDYISLQKKRFGETVIIEYRLQGNSSDLKIAPLILLPFVENAFKYGINPEYQSKIIIEIAIVKTRVYLKVINRDYSSLNLAQGTGIGIANTQNRLELLYNNRYDLLLNSRDGMFEVDLQLKLA